MPMPPSRAEVNQMANLIKMINSGVTTEEVTKKIETPLFVTEDATSEMKRILQAFRGADESPSVHLNERAKTDKQLREALITEKTPHGTRIGSWEIVINENENGLKSYDVTNIHTSEPIAKDLSLYDAAYGIVRCLNEGGSINNPKMREILSCEAEYAQLRQDAAIFREKAKLYERKQDDRQMVMEDRFDSALGRAKVARNRISELVQEIF